jgi:shikimate dehydrogenase
MHEAAYEALGMDARYVAFEPDPEDVGAALDGAAALGIAGLNVTVPFKRDVLEHVEPDDLAARIGAVNTVDFSGDTPEGYNTDVAGVRRSFAYHDVPIADRDAVVVGAGGAGKAVAFALADAGASVHVANRTVERAEALADAIDGVASEATAGGLDTLADAVPSADVLVNATSVGMDENRSPVPADVLHAGLTVLDAVYSPVETRLLREARERGAMTVDGAWMLLFQGVEAFEQWTGRDAPVDVMNETLRAQLS